MPGTPCHRSTTVNVQFMTLFELLFELESDPVRIRK